MSNLRNVEDEYPNFVLRFDSFYERRAEWTMLDRQNLLTRRNNANNYAEATIRVIKDLVLNRTKAFNVAALADYCVEVRENYLTTKLLHVAYDRKTSDVVCYETLCAKMSNIDKTSIVREDNGCIYHVPSMTHKGIEDLTSVV